jgi:nucleoside-diphosphate kinase
MNNSIIDDIINDAQIEEIQDFKPFKSCIGLIRLSGDEINYHGEYIVELSIKVLKFLVFNSINASNKNYDFSMLSISKAKLIRMNNLESGTMYECKFKVVITSMEDDMINVEFSGYIGRQKFYEAKMLFELSTEDEYTLCIIKPDAVSDGKDQEILQMLQANDLNIAQANINGINSPLIKKCVISNEDAKKLYYTHAEKPFYQQLVSFITSGEAVIVVLHGQNAIARYRKIMGATNPASAEFGTIRHKYAKSIDYNAVHGSDSQKNAETEIKIFFPEYFNYLDITWDYFNRISQE